MKDPLEPPGRSRDLQEPPDVGFPGDVGAHDPDVRAKGREFFRHRTGVRILGAAPARQHQMLHSATRHEPLRRLDPERSEAAGDQIGPVRVRIGPRLRWRLRPHKPGASGAPRARRADPRRRREGSRPAIGRPLPRAALPLPGPGGRPKPAGARGLRCIKSPQDGARRVGERIVLRRSGHDAAVTSQRRGAPARTALARQSPAGARARFPQ